MKVSMNVANAIVKLVAADALPALMGNLLSANLVHRDFEPVVTEPGATVNAITLDTHAEASFLIPDVTKVLAVPDLLRLYMEPAVVALAEKIETDIYKLFQRFSVDTYDSLRTSPGEPKYMITGVQAYSNLRSLPRFSEYQSAGAAGLRAMIDGPVGYLDGAFVVRSPYVDMSAKMLFTKKAIVFASRRLRPSAGLSEYTEIGNFGIRVHTGPNMNSLSQLYTVDILYGVAVNNAHHGLQLTAEVSQ
jgi:hypothetical protein